MKSLTAVSKLFVAVFLLVPTAQMAAAQGPPSDEVAYRVDAVDARSWIVTATNLDTGQRVKFRLNPRSFERKSFHADLGGRQAGERFGVTGPRNEPLDGCCEVEAAAGEARRGMTSRPGGSEIRPPQRRPTTRSAPPGRSPAAKFGGWEIVSVDRTGWVVAAREMGGGRTVRFRVDPQVFVGYEFRANLRDLRQGQGFTLIGLNSVPLSNCCTLLQE